MRFDGLKMGKLQGQIKRFLGRFSPHFHKPTVQFIGQALYGIQAFMRHGRWSRVTDDWKSPQLELKLDWG